MISNFIDNFFDHNQIQESLVLKFLFDERLNRVILEFDYANNVIQKLLMGQKNIKLSNEQGIQYDRDLRRLEFGNISKFKRVHGTNEALNTYVNNYFAKNTTYSVTVYDVKNRALKNGFYQIKVDFGDFGASTFEYDSLSFEQVLIRYDAKTNSYFDIISSNEVDFYMPFKKDV